MKSLDFAERHVSSRWIVGICKKDHPRPVSDTAENGVDIGREVLLRCHNRCRTIGFDGDWVHQKAKLGINRLISGPQIGMG